MAALLARLRNTPLLLADGAWGSHFIEAGLDLDPDSADAWNLSHRGIVAALAEDYVQAGVDILTTNTFGANRIRLARIGQESNLHAINQQGVAIAQDAIRNRASGRQPALIAGSIGPARGPGETRPDDAKLSSIFLEQATALVVAGVDFILLETMTDRAEACIAVRAAKAAGAQDVVCSFAFRESTPGSFETWSGDPVETALRAARDAGADVVGANCVPATAAILPLIRGLRRGAGAAPVWLKPNAGTPTKSKVPTPGQPLSRYSYPHPLKTAPVDTILDALETGIIGGCCGTTPADIAALRATRDHRTGR